MRLDLIEVSLVELAMFNKQKGFTLIELVITVSILALVMALALPSFKTSVANNKSLGAGGELVTALNMARSEAIKRGGYATVCASSDGATCLAAGNWAKGWLVFADKATSDTGAVDIGSVVRYWKDVPANATVTAVKQSGGSNVDYVRFTGIGMLANGATLELNLALPGCKGQQKNQIVVGVAGMITSKKVNCP